MRLNQFLAKNLGVSRRQGDEIIRSKKVKINGNLGELFTHVEEDDKVELFDINVWKTLQTRKTNQTILFYKPIFCVTTRFDPEKRKTIYDFLPNIYDDLKPAGRLDYMSEGLLVMSNNGDLIQSLTHPSQQHLKIYLVGLLKPLSSKVLQSFQMGVEIENYVLNPVLAKALTEEEKSQYTFLKLQENLNWYSFELSEGRNQQIRKMCELFDAKVQRLIRVSQGEYSISQELYEKGYLFPS